MPGCISKGSCELPDKIFDTSTLSLNINNQGIAILQYVVLTKDPEPITDSSVIMDFNGTTFKGFLESDSPSVFEGTEYYEHAITARGMVCNGGGGSPSI